MNLPVQIVEAKGVNESIFLGIPHNGRREREEEEDEEAGMNRGGSSFSPKTEHMWPRPPPRSRCSLLCSLALCPTDCHMVKIWAKWGEHLAS